MGSLPACVGACEMTRNSIGWLLFLLEEHLLISNDILTGLAAWTIVSI